MNYNTLIPRKIHTHKYCRIIRVADIPIWPLQRVVFVLNYHLICIIKAKFLCNSLIMSRYKIENKKRVTIWLLLKFPELP